MLWETLWKMCKTLINCAFSVPAANAYSHSIHNRFFGQVLASGPSGGYNIHRYFIGGSTDMIKVDLSGAAGFWGDKGPDWAECEKAHRTLA